MQTKKEAVGLRDALIKRAQALREQGMKEPHTRISFKELGKSGEPDKDSVVIPVEILSEGNKIRRRKTIQRILWTHTSFRGIADGRDTEAAKGARKDIVQQIESILDGAVPTDHFSLISISPSYGSPGVEVTIGAHFGFVEPYISMRPRNCRIWFKRESDGAREQAPISEYTHHESNRYDIHAVVPDMPGAPVGQDLTVYITQYRTYTVEVGDINTPPMVISVPVRTSNRLNFAWNAGPPVIEAFRLNSHDTGNAITVSPEEDVRLGWNVKHVRRIEVKRISAQGPACDEIYDFAAIQDYVMSSVDIGRFSDSQPANARYQITAENEFGSVSKIREAKLRVAPDLTILGVEVTQAIQRFTLDDTGTLPGGITLPAAAWNNSVDLVFEKRTMARVYLDSGIANGFSNGAGPNMQPNVTGRIRVYMMGSTEPLCTVSPLNPTGDITARAANSLNRDDMEHTLNFELPWDLPALVLLQIEARVWVRSDVDGTNHQNDPDYSGFKNIDDSTIFNLVAQGGQDMVRVLIPDIVCGIDAPSNTDYWDSVEGAETRFPVGINGFDFYESRGIVGCRDLTTQDGWEDLLADLVDLAGDYKNDGEIWTGLVPNDPSYAYNGLSWHRFFVARSEHPATFAHELAHCYDVGHADCGGPQNLDDRLPSHITETGVDVYDYRIHEQGVGELMSYCGGETRWISIALWDILIDEI